MRDLSKCIMCRRCETVCNKVQTVGTLTGVGRGFSAKVGTASMIPLADTSCTFCGQCVNACPVGAITGISYVKKVWNAINDPTKTVVVTLSKREVQLALPGLGETVGPVWHRNSGLCEELVHKGLSGLEVCVHLEQGVESRAPRSFPLSSLLRHPLCSDLEPNWSQGPPVTSL